MSLTGWYDNLVSELQYVRNKLNKLKTSSNLIISHVIQITSVVLLDVYCLFPTFYLSQVTSRTQKSARLVICQLIFLKFLLLCLAVPAEPSGSLLSPGCFVPSQLGTSAEVCPEGSSNGGGRKWWIPRTASFLEELLKIQCFLLLSLLWVLVLVSSYLLIRLLISVWVCQQASWALAVQ